MLAPLWSELISWLAANAPATHKFLRPPGDPARLIAAEEQLGFALGPELIEWWQSHDGVVTGYIVPGYELCGVDDMLRSHRIELEINLEPEINEAARAYQDLPDSQGRRPGRQFPPQYVPIGQDGAGNYLVVDFRPGAEYGCLRDHDHEDRGVIKPPYFSSVGDLLDRVVTSVRTGRPLEYPTSIGMAQVTPTITEGWLTWEGPPTPRPDPYQYRGLAPIRKRHRHRHRPGTSDG